jgi:hypothetical protein
MRVDHTLLSRFCTMAIGRIIGAGFCSFAQHIEWLNEMTRCPKMVDVWIYELRFRSNMFK